MGVSRGIRELESERRNNCVVRRGEFPMHFVSHPLFDIYIYIYKGS